MATRIQQPDALGTVMAALALLPEGLSSGRRLVMTTAPHLWRTHTRPEADTVVDVSGLLGGRSDWFMPFHGIEAYVGESLVRAGWPPESVVPEYRTSPRTSWKLDFGVLGPDGSLVLAVEVKAPSRALETTLDQLSAWAASSEGGRSTAGNEQSQHVLPRAALCVTNGSSYLLIDPTTGARRELHGPPGPSDVGVVMPPNAGSLVLETEQVRRPRTLEDLAALVEESPPEAVLIDFTMPLGARLSGEAPVMQLVPSGVGASRPSEPAWILLGWAASLPSVVAISAAVPPAVWFTSAAQWLRRYLAERVPLKAVIELPTTRPLGAVAVPLTLAYLQRGSSETYFDSVTSRGDLVDAEQQEWLDSLSAWLMGKRTSRGFACPVSVDGPWTASANNPEITKILDRLGRLGRLVRLGELCDVFPGGHTGPTQEADDGLPLVEGRALVGGTLDLSAMRRVQVNDTLSDRARLLPGDLLLASLMTDRSPIVLNYADVAAVVSSNVIVLRPKADVATAEYLREFLNSSVGRTLLNSTSSRLGDVWRVTSSDVRSLEIPLVEPHLVAGLDQLEQAEARLRAAADALQSKRRSLFEAENQRTFRQNLGEMKRFGQVLSLSVEQARGLEFQIGNFYPFPIAFGYRLLNGLVNPFERHREQLRVGENILAFLACVALAIVERGDRGETGIDLATYWQSGISPGDWRDLTRRCCTVLSTYKDHPLAAALTHLDIASEKSRFGKQAEYVIRQLNDSKHHRSPSAERLVADRTREIGAALADMMAQLAFFTDFPIRQVREMNVGRRGGPVTLTCLRYTGDHPGFQQEIVEFPTPLHSQDLYIQVTPRQWVPLYPFIQPVICQACQCVETYFVDKWDRKRDIGTAILKSFERGHTISDTESPEGLSSWRS